MCDVLSVPRQMQKVYQVIFSHDSDTDVYICLSKMVCLKYDQELGFNVAFNTVQVISRRVVGRAEETST